MTSLRRSGEWLKRHGGVLLVLVAIAARAPLATMLLCGEEGNFGSAVVKVLQRQRPRLVIARDRTRREYTTVPGHNLGGYVLPALAAAPGLALTGYSTLSQRAHAAVALRLAFLALYAAALFAALFTIPCDRRLVGGLLLLLFSLFTLPLLGSLQLQYDGAVSTLLVAVAALLVSAGLMRDRARPWLLAAAGLVVSVGKLEFLAAVAAALAVAAAWTRRPLAVVWFALGAAAGSLVCWLVDSANFLGGWDVIKRFSGIQEHIPLTTRVRAYLPENAAYLWPLYVALPLLLVAFAVTRQRRALLVPVALATFIFVGYVAIAWPGDHFPRYFAPVFVLVPIALAQLGPSPRLLAIVALMTVAPFAVRAWNHERSAGEMAMCQRLPPPFDARAWSAGQERSPMACVPALGMHSGPAIYSRIAPFACCGAQWTTEWPELSAQLCH